MSVDLFEAVNGFVGTILLAMAVVYGAMQIKQASASRRVELVRDFHVRYQQEPLRTFRQRFLSGALGPCETLSPEDTLILRHLIDELAYLGILVERRIVDFELVVTFFSWSPPRVWEQVRAFVEAERSVGSTFAAPLEHLADRYVANGYYTYGSRDSSLSRAGKTSTAATPTAD